MKHITPITLVVSFVALVYAMNLLKKQDEKLRSKQHQIQVLQGDSVIIHTFFENQSQKYKDFYVDFVNFKLNKQ